MKRASEVPPVVESSGGRPATSPTAADLKAALDAADRKACGPVAPAEGLYLTKVSYQP